MAAIPPLPVPISVADSQYDAFRSTIFWEQAHERSAGAMLSAEWAARLSRREWRSLNTALLRSFSFFEARDDVSNGLDGVLLVHANGNGDELGSASGGGVTFAELAAARRAADQLSRRARKLRTFSLATTLRANGAGKIFDRALVIELAAIIASEEDLGASTHDGYAQPVLVVLTKVSGFGVLSRTLRTSIRPEHRGASSPAA